MDPLNKSYALELRLNRTFNNRNALHNLGRSAARRGCTLRLYDAYGGIRARVCRRPLRHAPAEDAALQDRQAAVRLLTRVLAARAL